MNFTEEFENGKVWIVIFKFSTLSILKNNDEIWSKFKFKNF